MSLRTAQIKQIEDLYFNGHAMDRIADEMKISVSLVRQFMPSGELLIKLNKAVDVMRERDEAKALCNAVEQAITHIEGSTTRSVFALDDTEEVISALKLQLSNAQANKKALKAMISDNNTIVKAAQEELSVLSSDYERFVSEYETATSDKEKTAARLTAEAEAAAKVQARAKKAEAMAIEIITSAAIKAAKDTVADTIERGMNK